MLETLADKIRRHVRERHVLPAQRRGDKTVTVRSGDIHREMELTDRMPAVCAALDDHVFQEQAGVIMVRRLGRHQGATVEWQFYCRGSGASDKARSGKG